MQFAPPLSKTIFLLTAVLGVILSVFSHLNWCMLEGCQAWYGSEAYGLPISIWGIIYFVVLVSIGLLSGNKVLDFIRVLLLGAGLGVEIGLVYVQWAAGEWCPVCLGIAAAVFILIIQEVAILIKRLRSRIIGNKHLLSCVLLLILGTAVAHAAFRPIVNDLLPPADYDKRQVRIMLENVPYVGKTDSWPVVRVYSDYLCPYCRKQEPLINEMVKKYEEQARFYFCDLPIHGDASQFYITMYLACALADNTKEEVLQARETLFSLADEEILSPAPVINALRAQGLELLTASEPLASTYESIILLSRLDGVSSTPTVVIENRLGRRKIFKGKFEKKDLESAIEIMN